MTRSEKFAAFPCGRRTKWIVLGFWIIVAFAAGPLAGKLTEAQDNTTASWLPGSAESTKVLDRQQEFLPDEVVPATVVYERSSGIQPADIAKTTEDSERFGGLEQVNREIDQPERSADGNAIRTIVPISVTDDGWFAIGDRVNEIRDIAEENGNGLSVHITGPAGYAADSSEAFEGIDGILLLAAVGVVVVMLLLTYRSPILWVLPLITAAIALFGSQALIYLLAEAGLTVNAQSAGILTVLVFGAGTDYALLLVARYREELHRHEDRHEAMAFAMHRAGPAIIASAATVGIGMLCLLAAEMNSTRGLGPVAAIGVGIALLAMITLLPALLVIVGRWIFWPRRPDFDSAEPTETGLWARVGRGISHRPRVVWMTTVLVLGAMAVGLTSLNPGILENKDTLIGTTDAVEGEEVLAAHFPSGTGQPLVVIGNAAQTDELRTTLQGVDGISGLGNQMEVNGRVYLEGTLTDPADSQAARDTVERARTAIHDVPDAEALVGGDTAVAEDVSRSSSHDNNLIIPLVLVAVFLILALLLRALVAPLVLMATVVLSFGASLGVSALVFDHIFGFAGVDPSFPLFVFVFLVALGIDYNIFLMTRVREEAERVGTRRGALIGLRATGGVITSAGLVLAGTFAVLATLPLVFTVELGFAVAFGVLLDTMIVRAVLVTALNLEIGRFMWWPSKLGHKSDVGAGPTDIDEEKKPALAMD